MYDQQSSIECELDRPRWSAIRLALLAVAALVAPVPAQSGPRTLLSLNSEPGDYIGGGQQLLFTPADGDFIVSGDLERISVLLFSPTSFWFVDMTAPATRSLLPGMYEGALRGSRGVAPGLDVGGDGRGCNTLTGRFLVLEIAFDGGGNVIRFAADFEQHCEGDAPALYGSVRYESSFAVVPRASVGDTVAFEGDAGFSRAAFVVSLTTPTRKPVTVHYSTIDGTATAGSDYLAASGTAVFPAGSHLLTIEIMIPGNTTVQNDRAFSLKLTRVAGARVGDSSAEARIQDGDGPLHALYLNSEPEDYVGMGLSQTFTEATGLLTPQRNFDNGVSVWVDSWTFWNADFAGADGATLFPGPYEAAERFPFQPPGIPGLSVWGDGRGCNTLTGRFDVLEAAYADDGSIQQFAADFEQHCEDAAAALFGSLRVNAALRKVSTSDPAPSAQATGVASFTVSLWPPATEDVTVDYATVAETARAGIDYLPVAGTLTFTPGMTAQIVEVPFGHVRRVHVGSRFRLELTRAYGAAVWGEPARADVLNKLAVR